MALTERVLVIPTARLHAAGYFHGWRGTDDAFRVAILDSATYQFLPRSEVETDPAFKQLIPYIVLRHGDSLFHYRRGSTSTEKRLGYLRSVGIGGHISEVDAAGGIDPYQTGMMREIHEEVELGSRFRERCIGFINDDSTPVGSVHLGVVHLFELESPSARSREEALSEAGFAQLTDLLAAIDQFESWSQLVLQNVTTLTSH
jgi:predicted NUDIX family phosphoesterase